MLTFTFQRIEKCIAIELGRSVFWGLLNRLDRLPVSYLWVRFEGKTEWSRILPSNLNKFGNGLEVQQGMEVVLISWRSWEKETKHMSGHSCRKPNITAVNEISELPCSLQHPVFQRTEDRDIHDNEFKSDTNATIRYI